MKNKLLSAILLTAVGLIAGEPDGRALLDSLTSLMNPGASRAVMEQVITTTSGGTRTLVYEAYTSEKGDMSLMRYLEPTRVKGNAILMKDNSNQIWNFNPRTKRVRKLASSARNQKFEGSDFSYEDMGGGNTWINEYRPSNVGISEADGVQCYQLRLSALKGADPTYEVLDCYLRVTDLFPVRIDYYEKAFDLYKQLFLYDIQEIQGVLTPMSMTMKSTMDGTETTIRYREVDYEVHLDDSFFGEQELRK